jgi:hypothetical protein
MRSRGPAIIALIGRQLLWFIEFEQLHPDEERPLVIASDRMLLQSKAR